MKVQDDQFIHFTRKDRVQQILKDNKLLQKPPYPKFGTDTVDAVSTTYGKFLPSVQTTHTSKNTEELSAILFKTSTKPKIGYIEEVKWDSDVTFSGAKEISYSQAVSILSSTPETLEDDLYYVLYT